ncbi:RNA polymerase sigma factor [Kitasatospora sp. NPDC094011]|uniref:RNA polymerase sigma factor n=1 Tax=Kitasatospora sp. NPDC094011 TaxID=3364090 RepID=UPI003809C836
MDRVLPLRSAAKREPFGFSRRSFMGTELKRFAAGLTSAVIAGSVPVTGTAALTAGKVNKKVAREITVSTIDPSGMNGDPADFFKTHRAALFRHAVNLTGDWHKAEDLVQEVFIRMCGKWDSVDHSRPLYAYARKILLREFLASMKQSHERRESLVPEIPDRPAAGGSAILDGRTLEAILVLGRRQRQILYLRYVEDMPAREVAEVLGISPGTVTSQASRAVHRIRETLSRSVPDTTCTPHLGAGPSGPRPSGACAAGAEGR